MTIFLGANSAQVVQRLLAEDIANQSTTQCWPQFQYILMRFLLIAVVIVSSFQCGYIQSICHLIGSFGIVSSSGLDRRFLKPNELELDLLLQLIMHLFLYHSLSIQVFILRKILPKATSMYMVLVEDQVVLSTRTNLVTYAKGNDELRVFLTALDRSKQR